MIFSSVFSSSPAEGTGFLYETHLHTSQVSACAHSRGAEYVAVYRDLGYSGIFVTDHFCHGNCLVRADLPWKEWVKRFCAGYEDARNEGERLGVDVFFGWEDTFDGDDYLVYGLGKDWLLDHPEARSWTRKEQYQKVRAGGGCVVQAHPFRQHSYIRRVHLCPYCVDGVEAANGGNAEQSYDALAYRYGEKLGLAMTAGSDIHSINQALDKNVFGVRLDKKPESAADFARTVREKKIKSLAAPESRCALSGGEELIIAADIADKDDHIISHDWRGLLEL